MLFVLGVVGVLCLFCWVLFWVVYCVFVAGLVCVWCGGYGCWLVLLVCVGGLLVG